MEIFLWFFIEFSSVVSVRKLLGALDCWRLEGEDELLGRFFSRDRFSFSFFLRFHHTAHSNDEHFFFIECFSSGGQHKKIRLQSDGVNCEPLRSRRLLLQLISSPAHEDCVPKSPTQCNVQNQLRLDQTITI